MIELTPLRKLARVNIIKLQNPRAHPVEGSKNLYDLYRETRQLTLSIVVTQAAEVGTPLKWMLCHCRNRGR